MSLELFLQCNNSAQAFSSDFARGRDTLYMVYSVREEADRPGPLYFIVALHAA